MSHSRALLVGFAAIVVGACAGESTTPEESAEQPSLAADNVIYGLTENITKNGIRSGELHGDTAYFYEIDRRLDIVGVELRFYDEAGRQTGTLTAETAEYDLGTGSFVARREVVLVTQGPQGSRRLETEELNYDVDEDRLWSDSEFLLVQDGRRTRGQSFESDSEFRNWSVTGARTEGGVPSAGGETSQ